MARRQVMFYKPSRPQAPTYAKHPALADKVECSICRGLFLPAGTPALGEHRAWHMAQDDDSTRMTCKEAAAVGLTYKHPEYGLGAVPGHNQTEASLWRCDVCGEDVHFCASCREEHTHECAQWQEVRALVDAGNGEAADELADTILAARMG